MNGAETIDLPMNFDPAQTADLNHPLLVAERPAPAAPALPGYELERLLGRGAMGDVYQARDHKRGRSVALKVSSGATAEDRARVLAEAELQGQLYHPAIPRVLAAGSLADGRGYLVQGLVRGARPLGRALRADEPTLLAWIARAAEALAVAHGRCVHHGDVKPENLLVDEHGRLFLVDWGVARLATCAAPRPAQLSPPLEAHAERQAEWVQGTLAYMPPEQLRGQAGQPADVYALGLVLLEVLRGAHPLQALLVDANLLVSRVLHGDPIPVPESLPAPLGELLEACLSRDPAARPSASDMGWRLRQLVRGRRRPV